MLTEIEILKEKLEKNQIVLQKALEDKDTANKEFERMLEKYDRQVALNLAGLILIRLHHHSDAIVSGLQRRYLLCSIWEFC